MTADGDDAAPAADGRSESAARDRAVRVLGEAVLDALGADWRSVDPRAFRDAAAEQMREDPWRACVGRRRPLDQADAAYRSVGPEGSACCGYRTAA